MDAYKPPDAVRLIQQLGESLGIPELALDNKLACLLVFDRTVPVNIAVDTGESALILMSYLGPVEASATGDMLAANYLWRATHGATLALDASRKGGILIHKLSLPTLTFAQFRSQLNVFVDLASHWQKKLASAPHGREGVPARGSRAIPRLPV